MRFFSLYFIIEIVLLVVAGRFLGIWLTLFIILATSIFGVLILRIAGLSTLLGVRQRITQGEAPNTELVNGVLLGLGGGLLFLPGLLGNIFGVLLVIPMTRKLFMRFAKTVLIKYSKQPQYTYSKERQEEKIDVIEGEWERKNK